MPPDLGPSGQPVLMLTDLSPEQRQGQEMSAACYGLRAWIEQGIRCLKGGAYHYHRTRITDPARAERVWLVMAVSLGSVPEAAADGTGGGLLGFFTVGVRRVLRVHRSGWIELLVAALRGEDLPMPEELIQAPLPALPSDLALMSSLSGPDPPP